MSDICARKTIVLWIQASLFLGVVTSEVFHLWVLKNLCVKEDWIVEEVVVCGGWP